MISLNEGLTEILEKYPKIKLAKSHDNPSEEYEGFKAFLKNFIDSLENIISQEYKIKYYNLGRKPWVPYISFKFNENSGLKEDYYVTYLFNSQGKGVYLTLGLGVKPLKNNPEGKPTNKDLIKIYCLKRNFKDFLMDKWDNNLNFKSDDLNLSLDLAPPEIINNGIKSFKYSTLFSKFYPFNEEIELPTEEKLKSDLNNFFELFRFANNFDKDFVKLKDHISSENLNFSIDDIEDMIKSSEDSIICYEDEYRCKTGKNILYYGVPGSGKSCEIKKQLKKKGVSNSQKERIIFHPDYTYSDFVGQILPEIIDDDRIIYKFTPGPFTRILKKAFNNPEKDYYLIIEEINRGNAPAIFGDIFQLLDRIDDDSSSDSNINYPEGTSEYFISNSNIADNIYKPFELEIYGSKLRIPSNLSIFATMNTSDQNVFTLDTAFQRRWNMELIENKIDYEDDLTFNEDKILDTNLTWKQFCYGINQKIIEENNHISSSEDKRLGTYFINKKDFLLDLDEDDNKFSDLLEQKSKNFSEKVLKYLWDDAFKFSRDKIFNTKKYGSLDLIIKEFKNNEKEERFKIFKEGVYDDLRNIVFENNSEG